RGDDRTRSPVSLGNRYAPTHIDSRWAGGRRYKLDIKRGGLAGGGSMSAEKSNSGEVTPVEYMITAIADMLDGLGHVAVGARSPIPGSAAHLAAARSGGRLRVSILGSRRHSSFTDGARELFDCAGQGRIDAFFLSGGQIDRHCNIHLLRVG